MPAANGNSGPSTTIRGRIVIADDLPANLDLLERLLSRDDHTVYRARDGEEALVLVDRHLPDLVLADVMMPGRTGFEVCSAVKGNAATRLIPVVLVTASHDTQDKIRGLDAGADDFLTKPLNPPELQARVRSLLRIKRYTSDLESAESVILSLAHTIEARDAYTDGHCQRLAAYANALGTALELAEDDLAALTRGAVLHDVGKVGIPDAVLLKRGPLTPEEYEIMKQHTLIGDRLCGDLRSLRNVRPIVRSHHERLDGSGYPDGLAGDEVPLLAQIIGIVDVFDALTSVRPYKIALTAKEACRELSIEAARGWRQQRLVEVFTTLVDQGALVGHVK